MGDNNTLSILLDKTFELASRGQLDFSKASGPLKELIRSEIPDEQKIGAASAIMNGMHDAGNRHIAAFMLCNHAPKDSGIRLPVLRIAFDCLDSINQGPDEGYRYKVTNDIYDRAPEDSDLRTQALKKRLSIIDRVQMSDRCQEAQELYRDAFNDKNLKTKSDREAFLKQITTKIFDIVSTRPHEEQLGTMTSVYNYAPHDSGLKTEAAAHVERLKARRANPAPDPSVAAFMAKMQALPAGQVVVPAP